MMQQAGHAGAPPGAGRNSGRLPQNVAVSLVVSATSSRSYGSDATV